MLLNNIIKIEAEEFLKELGYKRIDNKEDWEKYLFSIPDNISDEPIEFKNQNFWVKDTEIKKYNLKWFNSIKVIDYDFEIFINNYHLEYGTHISNAPYIDFRIPALFLIKEIDNLLPIKNLILNGL